MPVEVYDKVKGISIHSLIRGRTAFSRSISALSSYFNPLPHTRENVRHNGTFENLGGFQSTPSYEGELSAEASESVFPKISIHSLIRGRTIASKPRRTARNGFQSTPSYEGERLESNSQIQQYLFQSTPSYEGELAVFGIYPHL